MVSVIIPTYNRADTLKESIVSVINQGDYINEIIIIDDNSSDCTEKIVKSLNDSRIIYKKLNKSVGACNARNIGINLSSYDYIAFHDSDDIWCQGKIEKQINILKNKKVDIVCSGFNKYYNDNVTYIGRDIESEDIYKELLKENFIGTPTIFGKKECFKSNMFDSSMPRFQDWELMIRLSKKYKVYFLNEPLVNAYVQENSISKKVLDGAQALKIILKKNMEEISCNKVLLESYYRRIGVYSLETNDYHKYFYEAIKANKSIKSIIDYILSLFHFKSLLKRIHN
ncbi:glycosyltransferase family 2 protein [Clostridium sp. HCS.1]|uniref:glycosyltransferase family 2 protein n=1 Tax=Clostridium sp. HCS.1 TaxID=3238594 RepID=UPI003A1033CB